MQITETAADGLRREFKIVVPAQDIESQVQERLVKLARDSRLPGFRPGKAPLPMIRQRYGSAVKDEVIEQKVDAAWRRLLKDNALRPAIEPKIQIATPFQPGVDLEVAIALEVLPEIEPGDFSGLELEKLVTPVDDKNIDQMLTRLAENRQETTPVAEPRPAQDGDVVVIDFDGSVDGEAKPGMKAEGHHLRLGSGSFIPGFENQLVGANVGEDRKVVVTFPADYGHKELAGREAVFAVAVKELRESKPIEINDELAVSFGHENLDALKNAIRARFQRDYDEMSRSRLKRALLDKLAEIHTFPTPPTMVEAEFEAIWKRRQMDIDAGNVDQKELERNEDDLKAEYRSIAERRVRLGLLLAEVGRRNNISVSQEELNQGVVAEAKRYPGQERRVFEFFNSHPEAVEHLRAPMFEAKTVDFILELVKTTERQVTVEELSREIDDEDEAVAA